MLLNSDIAHLPSVFWRENPEVAAATNDRYHEVDEYRTIAIPERMLELYLMDTADSWWEISNKIISFDQADPQIFNGKFSFF